MKTQDLITFFITIEKAKTTLRHAYTSDRKRQESDAEHSWMCAMIAMTVFPTVKIKVDQEKVLKMILIHDLAEIITSDIPPFEDSERQKNKHAIEAKALKKILQPLTISQQEAFLSLWEEFEAQTTPEAKLAQAIDKMEATLSHNIADISTWDQNDFDIHPYYRDEYFHFDETIRILRDAIEIMSMSKITDAHALSRIKPEHAKKYQELKNTYQRTNI